MQKHFLKVEVPAAPFGCPLAPFVQQLSPAFGRVSGLEFFPEGIFLTSKQKAAGFFNASVDTVDKWIAKGLIKPYKRGRTYFFPIEGLALALNEPQIRAFIKRKALWPAMFRRRKQAPNLVKYWTIAVPGSRFMYLRIRYRGINIVWFCLPSVAEDKKEMESFISDVITLYFKCQTLKPSGYEKN
jgi:hypothetical protein